MTPEAQLFLAKAQEFLSNAKTMMNVGLVNDAGRAAYLAGFHAAQAFIFENTGKTAKAHSGVQNLFVMMAMTDDRIPVDLRPFISQAYNLKAVADYETGPRSQIPAEKSEWAIVTAERFLTCITVIVAGPLPLP